MALHLISEEDIKEIEHYTEIAYREGFFAAMSEIKEILKLRVCDFIDKVGTTEGFKSSVEGSHWNSVLGVPTSDKAYAKKTADFIRQTRLKPPRKRPKS